jgi:hypothetical protein
MGFFDRLLGREEQQQPARPQRSDDEIAVERYQYLLRTAPPETIEQVHTEAFSKLTPQQRDILFEKLTENSNPSERPADAEPATLAKAATRAEFQQPGSMARALGGYGSGGPSFGSMVGSSLLGSIAGYVIGSALVSTFMPNDFGQNDAGVDGSGNSDPSTDASADGGEYDSGGGSDSGGDFGGGDFGGGGF